MSNNRQAVKDFIIQNFLYGEGSRLYDETSFLGNSIIDSTGILELVTFLEEKYGIVISDDEIIPANLDSLKNIDNYIKNKLNGHEEKEDEISTPYSDDVNRFDAKPLEIISKEQIFPEDIEKLPIMPKPAL